MNFSATDINQIALDTKANMQAILSEKGLELKTELASGIPLVSVDKDRIMQVFMNLINNAMKFTNHGFILIKTEPWNQDFAKVTIQDTGIGIAKEDIDKLFHRFSQIESKDHPQHGSTGLGLAICKEIIEKHKGKIWVESESGKGSSFIFTIPFLKESEEDR